MFFNSLSTATPLSYACQVRIGGRKFEGRRLNISYLVIIPGTDTPNHVDAHCIMPLPVIQPEQTALVYF